MQNDKDKILNKDLNQVLPHLSEIHSEDHQFSRELSSPMFSPGILQSSNNQLHQLKETDTRVPIPEIVTVLRDQFIGEFNTEQGFRIIRAFLGQSSREKVYYTRCDPVTIQPKASVLIVHGFGDSSEFLDVFLLVGICFNSNWINSSSF